MAEFIAALLTKVVDLGVVEAQRHVSGIASVKDELRKLESELKAIQPILEDAHNKQFKSKHIKDWISRVNQIFYDAEDIIDLYRTKTSHLDAQTGQGKVRNLLSSLSFSCRNLSFLHKTAYGIKGINERLNMTYKEKDHYGLVPIIGSSRSPQDLVELYGNRLTTSCIVEPHTFGREKDEEVVVEWLKKDLNSEVEKKTCVMAIVGMGGLGKTTLAKKVYNHSSIQEHFEKSVWICASEKPKLMELFKQILEGFAGKGSGANEIMGLDFLSHEILKHLKEKRFLLVIDDAWDYGWWSELNGLLQQGAPGSRVLITTRGQQVEVGTSATYLHRLTCLSYDDSWRLFINKVLRRDEKEELDRMKDIGRVIVEKCKGLPLALSVVGSMLKYKERRRSDWQEVANSPFWEWEGIVDHDDNKQILSTIALSYMNLPFALKKCLTYCSIYPKDYPMSKDELVKLWVLEGFISKGEEREMEIYANNYLQALVGCSLIQVESEYKCYYKLHDIVHDFACYMRGSESANLSSSEPSASTQVRSYCLAYSDQDFIDGTCINHHRKLRTLLLVHHRAMRRLSPSIFLQLKWLRVLDLSGNYRLDELPESLGNLALLKYLNVSCTSITLLPESVSKLKNLERLNVNHTRIRMLPRGTSKLKALRHLHLERAGSLECLPRGIGKLTCLRTLSMFLVGSDMSARSGSSMKELRHINNLEAVLKIHHIERVETREEAKDAELHKKAKLQELELSCEPDCVDGYDSEFAEKMEGIFEELQPPMDLKTLKMSYYGGTKFPAWISSASSLEYVTIDGCKFLKELPTLAHLPNLVKLEISGASSVKIIDDGFHAGSPEHVGFPKLEALVICNMESLEKWSLNARTKPMPCLQSLRIENCPKLRALPVGFPTLESVVIWNMESLEVWPQAEPMSHLQILKLKDCPMLKVLPLGFPKLESLLIRRMESLEEWSINTQSEKMPSLQSLEIQGCPKLRALPDGLQFTKLRGLELSGLPELNDPISLASLQNVQVLRLHGLPNVEFQHLKSVTALRRLDLEGFPNLDMDSQMVKEAIGNMNQLEILRLRDCPKLAASIATTLQRHHLPKLQYLQVFSVQPRNHLRVLTYSPMQLELDIDSLEELSGFRNLGSRVHSLEIRLMSEIDSVPEWIQNLCNLQRLLVEDSSKLTHLPEWLGELSQLRKLELRDLPLLRSLPDGMQPLLQIESLTITNCFSLNNLPEWLGQLTKLRELDLHSLAELRSLPDRMRDLIQLTDLSIREVPRLRRLPEGLGNLPSLRLVRLYGMPELRSLPDGMRDLPKIETLDIWNCPQLDEPCIGVHRQIIYHYISDVDLPPQQSIVDKFKHCFRDRESHV